jgi:hypothetical protein
MEVILSSETSTDFQRTTLALHPWKQNYSKIELLRKQNVRSDELRVHATKERTDVLTEVNIRITVMRFDAM